MLPGDRQIGQLLDEPGAPTPTTAVGITQTGDMCRAISSDAGYPQVPVIALSVQGLEDNPGFRLGVTTSTRLSRLVIGDTIQ